MVDAGNKNIFENNKKIFQKVINGKINIEARRLVGNGEGYNKKDSERKCSTREVSD